MHHYAQGGARGQVRCARRQLRENPNLCFEKLLPRQKVDEMFQRHGVQFRRRLYTPLLTLWTFLYQVLSEDRSCMAAVARLLAALSLGHGPAPSGVRPGVC